MNPPEPEALKKARALWLQDRFDEALKLFGEVLLTHPRHPLALLDAARAYGARYRITEAETLLDRYLEVTGSDARTLALAGQTYRMIHRGKKALLCFERAQAFGETEPPTVLEHALLLERSGNPEEASRILSELLRKSPGMPEAEFFNAVINLRMEKSAAARECLVRLAGNSGIHPYLRTRAFYALAEAADKSQDPDSAIQYAVSAKKFGLADAAELHQTAKLIGRQADEISQAFSAETLERWKAEVPDHPPVALLTGSPRSGTTLLEKVLDAHPGILSSDEHDLFARFLVPPLLHPDPASGFGSPGNFLKESSSAALAEMRLSYFKGMEELLGVPLAGQLMLDKNPSMTDLIPVWLRMVPHSKIILMLRDPRDVVLSCFLNYFPLNAYSVSFLTLEAAARRYALEMDHWLRLRSSIPESQWIEIRYEDCVDDLFKTAGRVLEKLGLPWSDDISHYRGLLNSRITQSPTYADVQAPLYHTSVGKWRRYARHLSPVQHILQPYIRQFGYPEA